MKLVETVKVEIMLEFINTISVMFSNVPQRKSYGLLGANVVSDSREQNLAFLRTLY